MHPIGSLVILTVFAKKEKDENVYQIGWRREVEKEVEKDENVEEGVYQIGAKKRAKKRAKKEG